MTGRLEELILKGKAEYKTYTQAFINGVLQVPKDSFIVITDLSIKLPGVQEEPVVASLLEQMQQNPYYLRLRSEAGKEQNFLLRNDFDAVLNGDPLLSDYSCLPKNEYKFSLYGLHSTDVNVQLAVYNRSEVGTATLIQDFIPPGVNSPNQPDGYGKGASGVPVVAKFSTNFINWEVFTVSQRDKTAPSTNSNSYSHFKVPFLPQTTPYFFLNNIGDVDFPSYWCYTLPIINIGYVEIFEPKPENIF